MPRELVHLIVELIPAEAMARIAGEGPRCFPLAGGLEEYND